MATTLTNYSGLFFRKYAKKVITSFTPNSLIQAKKPVGKAEKIGERFVVPITIAQEQGITYAANGVGAFTLSGAIDGEVKSLEILGSNHAFQSVISYEAAASSLGSDTAADNTTGRVAESLRSSARKRIEIDFLYGRIPIGIVESVTASTVTLTEAHFAPNIFVGCKGARFEFFAPGSALPGVPGGERATGASFQTLSSMNSSTRTLTFTGTSVVSMGVVAGDWMFFENQFVDLVDVFNSAVGLHAQLASTSASGSQFDTHFGITRNEILTGNSVDALGGRLSFDVVQEGISKCQDMGMDMGSMVLLCSPLTWVRLNSDISADRRYDGSYTKAKGELGVESIVYHSAAGSVEIVAHPLVKRGFAYGFAWDELIRPGAYDLAFTRPSGNGSDPADFSGNMLLESATLAGYEIRMFHNSAIAHVIPSHAFIVTNINNA